MRFLLPLLCTLALPALSWAQGGCYGAPKGYGCQGAYRTGSGCFGTPKSYGYGCQGYTAGTGCIGYQKTGCYGGGQTMGFPPTASYERYERYDGPATLPPPRGYAAAPQARYGYAAAPVPFGSPVGDGTFNTRTGAPPAPGVFQHRGPIVDALRLMGGYDPEPMPWPSAPARRRGRY